MDLNCFVCAGAGSIEGSYFLEELPKMLGLEASKVRLITKELVQSRKRMMLVQVRVEGGIGFQCIVSHAHADACADTAKQSLQHTPVHKHTHTTHTLAGGEPVPPETAPGAGCQLEQPHQLPACDPRGKPVLLDGAAGAAGHVRGVLLAGACFFSVFEGQTVVGLDCGLQRASLCSCAE